MPTTNPSTNRAVSEQPIFVRQFFNELAPMVVGSGATILQNLFYKNTFGLLGCEYVKIQADAGTISVDETIKSLQGIKSPTGSGELLSTPRTLSPQMLKVKAGLNPIDYFNAYQGHFQAPARKIITDTTTTLQKRDHKAYILQKMIDALVDTFDNALLNGDYALPADEASNLMNGLNAKIAADSNIVPVATGAVDGTTILADVEDNMLAALPGKEYRKRWTLVMSPQNRLLYERKWRETYQSVLTGNDEIARIPGTGVEIHAHPHLVGSGMYLFKPEEVKLGYNFHWAGEAYADFWEGRIFIRHTFPADIQYEKTEHMIVNDMIQGVI